jgi:hypothetical protein
MRKGSAIIALVASSGIGYVRGWECYEPTVSGGYYYSAQVCFRDIRVGEGISKLRVSSEHCFFSFMLGDHKPGHKLYRKMQVEAGMSGSVYKDRSWFECLNTEAFESTDLVPADVQVTLARSSTGTFSANRVSLNCNNENGELRVFFRGDVDQDPSGLLALMFENSDEGEDSLATLTEETSNNYVEFQIEQKFQELLMTVCRENGVSDVTRIQVLYFSGNPSVWVRCFKPELTTSNHLRTTSKEEPYRDIQDVPLSEFGELEAWNTPVHYNKARAVEVCQHALGMEKVYKEKIGNL